MTITNILTLKARINNPGGLKGKEFQPIGLLYAGTALWFSKTYEDHSLMIYFIWRIPNLYLRENVVEKYNTFAKQLAQEVGLSQPFFLVEHKLAKLSFKSDSSWQNYLFIQKFPARELQKLKDIFLGQSMALKFLLKPLNAWWFFQRNIVSHLTPLSPKACVLETDLSEWGFGKRHLAKLITILIKIRLLETCSFNSKNESCVATKRICDHLIIAIAFMLDRDRSEIQKNGYQSLSGYDTYMIWIITIIGRTLYYSRIEVENILNATHLIAGPIVGIYRKYVYWVENKYINPLVINIIEGIPFAVLLFCKYNLRLGWAIAIVSFYISGRLFGSILPIYFIHLWQLFFPNFATTEEEQVRNIILLPTVILFNLGIITFIFSKLSSNLPQAMFLGFMIFSGVKYFLTDKIYAFIFLKTQAFLASVIQRIYDLLFPPSHPSMARFSQGKYVLKNKGKEQSEEAKDASKTNIF